MYFFLGNKALFVKSFVFNYLTMSGIVFLFLLFVFRNYSNCVMGSNPFYSFYYEIYLMDAVFLIQILPRLIIEDMSKLCWLIL